MMRLSSINKIQLTRVQYYSRLTSTVMSSVREDSRTGSALELWKMLVSLPWNFMFEIILIIKGEMTSFASLNINK